MRIGFISDFFPMYGAKSVAKVIRIIEESGHSAVILSSNMLQNGEYDPAGTVQYGSRSTLVRFKSRGFAPNGSPMVVPVTLPLRANSIFTKYGVDLVHVHFLASYSFQMYALLSFLKKSFPLVGTPHGVVAGYNTRFMQAVAAGLRISSRIVLQAVDRFTIVSKLTSHFLQNLGVSEERIVYIPNGVDVGLYCPRDKETAERMLNLKSTGRKRVLFLAHLRESKGVDLFMDAAEHITTRRNDVEFMIIGSGPLTNRVKMRCSHGIGRISHLSYVDESLLPYAFACADIYVLPSFVEGLPQSLLESMSCGVPSIATDVGGVSELFSAKTGFALIRPGEIGGLVEAIDFLLENKEKRIKLGKMQRENIMANYSLAKTGRRYLSVYEDLLKKGYDR